MTNKPKEDDEFKSSDFKAIGWIILAIIGVCVAAGIGNGLYHLHPVDVGPDVWFNSLHPDLINRCTDLLTPLLQSLINS